MDRRWLEVSGVNSLNQNLGHTYPHMIRKLRGTVVSRTAWPAPKDFPSLDRAGVHIWAVVLSKFVPDPRLLSADERVRAAEMTPARKKQFLTCRSLLRRLLSRYLGVSPGDVIFKYNKNGKPSLGQNNRRLYFNLAHTENLALIAVGKRARLGIDVEPIRRLEDAMEIAKQYFSAREFKLLKACGGKERIHMFFRFWTAKEAYVKARGGRVWDFTSKCVDVARCNTNGEVGRVICGVCVRWFSPAAGLLAALACNASCNSVTYFSYEESMRVK